VPLVSTLQKHLMQPHLLSNSARTSAIEGERASRLQKVEAARAAFEEAHAMLVDAPGNEALKVRSSQSRDPALYSATVHRCTALPYIVVQRYCTALYSATVHPCTALLHALYSATVHRCAALLHSATAQRCTALPYIVVQRYCTALPYIAVQRYCTALYSATVHRCTAL
jgi:hypothetical protein